MGEQANGLSKDVAAISGTRFVGWDAGWSAYGVDGMVPFSGYASYIIPTNQAEGSWEDVYWIDHMYIGALNPLVAFDTASSRFQIKQLHTARKQRNTLLAGSVKADVNTTHPLNPDVGKDIYEINPALNSNTMLSYMPFIPEALNVAKASSLIKNFAIIDAKCGIFITDWGVTEANWSKGLWGKLGFSYSQLVPSGKTRQGRSTTTTSQSFPVTTNADVNTTQALSWAVNPYGAPQETLQLPQNSSVGVASVSETATSVAITAKDLAQQQTDGYWLVRSSLIDNSMFLSTKGLSPVIAVIDKSYSSSDFIYLGDSSVDFLITKQITLTNIVTSLHLPDGSFARTDPKSAVIYKIVKPNTIPVSIIDSFIKKK